LPPAVLLGGIIALLAIARRRRAVMLEPAALSREEQTRMRNLTE